MLFGDFNKLLNYTNGSEIYFYNPFVKDSLFLDNIIKTRHFSSKVYVGHLILYSKKKFGKGKYNLS